MNDAGQTICLNMIVKNETHVLGRCLASVLPLIDSWVIVDTGSSDGTQQFVRNYLRELPGELFERPWVDFAVNRTQALELARGRADYLLLIDADESLELTPVYHLPPLTADSYGFEVASGTLNYTKTGLVRSALPWRYEGVCHEYILCAEAGPEQRLPGVRNLRVQDGARSRDPLRFRRDALLLEGALLQDPANPRTMFYLGQSYADAGEYALAIERYTRRAAMGGWYEEVWYSLYQIARLRQALEQDWPTVLAAYLAAYSFRPDRAEPLFRIGIYYGKQAQYAVAYLFLAQGLTIPYPAQDTLFVEPEIYSTFLPLEYSVACFYVGRHQEAIETADRLLAGPSLSPEMREQILRNRQFSLDVVGDAASGFSQPEG